MSFFCGSAFASTTVNLATDSGDTTITGTLSWAISQVNAGTTASPIILDLATPYTLSASTSSPPPAITASMTIEANTGADPIETGWTASITGNSATPYLNLTVTLQDTYLDVTSTEEIYTIGSSITGNTNTYLTIDSSLTFSGSISSTGLSIENALPKMKQEIESAQNSLDTLPNRLLKEEVEENLIAYILAKSTGVPVEKMLEGESQKLLHLEENLSHFVIGQSFAIESVSEAIRRSRSGLSAPSRPLGTFLFVGPTGVGKTELAKALAFLLFNQEKSLLRLDMSEYMEKHSISKLIGSPPGYAGYEEGGGLTEALRRRPYSVLLIDEIEKAHPDVENILLQLFDDGRVTDSKGKTVNCKNALFIMTSNLGPDLLLDKIRTSKTELGKQDVLNILNPVLKSHFRPEFLNRIDDILPFLPLTQKEMENVTTIELEKVKSRLQEKNILLKWTPSITAHLAQKGYDPFFGARPIKRLIEQEIVNQLSRFLLKGSLKSRNTIELTIDSRDNLEKIHYEIYS